MSRIWEACREAARPGRLAGTLLRVVESQEQVATNALVDGLDEQEMLERMLERTKPPLRSGTEGLHYLLATPFRYPPLRHGSRFGSATEPSLLYGALERPTVLAEAAYYRLVFWQGMVAPPEGGLLTQHTLFGADYATPHGLRLQKPPFDAFHAELTDPSDYRECQALGTALREAGIEAFEYRSARATTPGYNVGLFTPAALAASAPAFQEPWLCETSGAGVRFYSRQDDGLYRFPLDAFLVGDRLPMPAV
ncbi:MAG TPA: RES family NAD+ phosphorylase [Gammaproteobacteria bacterium]|nr:RES family NAD+ phosphorylase [Gammaproteobacteria bacterium]